MRLNIKSFRIAPMGLAAILALSGCLSLQSQYTVESWDDETRGHSIRRLVNNFLGGAYRIPGSLQYSAQLNPQKTILVKRKKGAMVKVAHYSLVVRLRELSWVHIRAGASLEITADGRRFTYSGRGSLPFRKIVPRGRGEVPLKHEVAYWHSVQPEDLRAISRARNVTVIIKGEKRDLNYFFTDKNYSNFRRFVAEHVD